MALKIGVLGYQFMGTAHSNAFARLPMFFPDAPAIERHTLVGRDEDALADAADQLDFSHTATDWEEAIEDIDVFYNLGPNHVHPEPSIAALESDVPTFCEKPLAPTAEDAERMAEAAAASDAIAGCAFNYRFVPAIQYAKNLIDAGELGEIRHVRGHYLQDGWLDPAEPWTWRTDEDLAGAGALGDLGAHTIDLARFLVGEQAGDIDRISGHTQTFIEERPVEGEDETRPVTVDDAYSAQAEFGNGAMGTFEASRLASGHKNDHTIAVHGSEGSLKFALERLNELELLRGDGRGYETVLVTDESDPYVEHWWPPGHVLGWEHTFIHEDYEFLSAVADGEEYEPSFETAFEVQRVLDAIQRSDERGEWVAVGE
jgi:predicted dehydrogenase